MDFITKLSSNNTAAGASPTEFDFAEALLAYTQAIRSVDANDAPPSNNNSATLIQLYLNRSFVNLSLQRFASALDDATHAVELGRDGVKAAASASPPSLSSWQALLKRARILTCMGRFDEALTDVREATSAQPLAIFPWKRDLELMLKLKEIPSSNAAWRQPGPLQQQLRLQHEHEADYCLLGCEPVSFCPTTGSAAAEASSSKPICVRIENPIQRAVFSYVKRKATSMGCKASVAQLFDLLIAESVGTEMQIQKKEKIRQQLSEEFGFDPLSGHGMLSLVQIQQKKYAHEQTLMQNANPSFVHFCARPNLFVISESARHTHGSAKLYPGFPRWTNDVAAFFQRVSSCASATLFPHHSSTPNNNLLTCHGELTSLFCAVSNEDQKGSSSSALQRAVNEYKDRKESRRVELALGRITGLITKKKKRQVLEAEEESGEDEEEGEAEEEKLVAPCEVLELLRKTELMPLASAGSAGKAEWQSASVGLGRLDVPEAPHHALRIAVASLRAAADAGTLNSLDYKRIFDVYDPPPQCTNARCGKLLLMEEPPECQCGARYCSLACYCADFEAHKEDCAAFTTDNAVFVALSAIYWDCVMIGVFPWVCGPSVWQQTKTSSDSNACERKEDEFWEFDTCMDRVKEELSDRVVEIQRYCRRCDRTPAETANCVTQELLLQHRAMSTPLPTDTLQRLTFKLVMVSMVRKALAGMGLLRDSSAPAVESVEATVEKFKPYLRDQTQTFASTQRSEEEEEEATGKRSNTGEGV